MSGAAEDALLDDPRIGADLEHVEIVIGFENQAIGVAQMDLDQLRHVAEVGDESDLDSIGAEREADRIGSIVGNGKRVHFDVADAEALPGVNGLDTAEAFAKSVRQRAIAARPWWAR